MKNFEIDEGELIEYTGDKKNIVVPEGVTKIVGGAFDDCCDFVESITLPSTVEIIDNDAFSNCCNLKRIAIQPGVKYIGEQAFEGCESLKSIVIPNTVKYIGERAFCGCNSLEEMEIPFIGACSSLHESPAGPFGRIFGEDIMYDDKVINVEQCTRVILSDEIRTEIATLPKSLKKIILNNVKNVSAYAFYNCSMLQTIQINNKVSSIGYMAFANCRGLKELIVDSVEVIRDGAFDQCINLEKIVSRSDVDLNTINKGAFAKCLSLKEIELSSNLQVIEKNAFLGCENLEIVKYLGSLAHWSYLVSDNRIRDERIRGLNIWCLGNPDEPFDKDDEDDVIIELPDDVDLI